jgi:hypothetical protein
MRKITVITAIAAFFPLSIFAQDSTWKKRADTSAVAIHKDPRLDLLIKKQIQINEETTREARKVGKGYRLLVINTNKREDAIAAKTKVYTYFPELKAYLIYQSPYFKVKVGNFKERKEAEDYQKKLRSFFPNGVFIMNDIIEMKPEKEEVSREPEPEPNPECK